MRRAKVWPRAVLAVLLCPGTASAGGLADYRLTPVVVDGALVRLAVELRFTGEPDGETRLRLPDRYGAETELWRHVAKLTVEGATVHEADAPHRRILNHAPGAAVTVRYEIEPGYAEDPPAGRNPYRPIIRPTWFALVGESVFARPSDDGDAPARFQWGPAPAGWSLASDLDHPGPLTLNALVQSVSVGGSDWTVIERRAAGAPVRIAYRGQFAFRPEALADMLVRVVEADHAYWGDAARPFFVPVVPLTLRPGSYSLGGTGRDDAFSVYASPNVREADLRSLLAHEHGHSWIPDRLGGSLPGRGQDPLQYWFSEGFTDFHTYRLLLRSGLWTLEEYLDNWNTILAEYAQSSVRTAPNSRIAESFWNDREVYKLPHQRGALAALVWDHRLRSATKGRRDLDDVLLAMRDRTAEVRAVKGVRTPGSVLLPIVAMDVAGVDLRPEMARVIDRGEVISLAPDLFAGCAVVRTTQTPVFDIGFDREASRKNNVIRGVRRDHPAYRAGLRDGMRVEIMTGTPGDPRADWTITVVEADGTKRDIRYKPEGQTAVTVQQIALTPSLTRKSRATCVWRMSGR